MLNLEQRGGVPWQLLTHTVIPDLVGDTLIAPVFMGMTSVQLWHGGLTMTIINVLWDYFSRDENPGKNRRRYPRGDLPLPFGSEGYRNNEGGVAQFPGRHHLPLRRWNVSQGRRRRCPLPLSDRRARRRESPAGEGCRRCQPLRRNP